MHVKFSFDSTGLVSGISWAGGRGSYPARQLHAETLEDLVKQAIDGLNGSLDSGMGYESLIGAMLDITKTTTIIVNVKPFCNEENLEPGFIGELTDEVKEVLFEQANYM